MDAAMRAMVVARNWGKSPSEWRALSVDDRGWMMATDYFESTLENYRSEWRETHRKDGKGKGRSEAENDFTAMKKRLRIKD